MCNEYPCQDFLCSLISNLIHENNNKDRFLLVSLNRYLHMNANNLKKLNDCQPNDENYEKNTSLLISSRWVLRLHFGQHVPPLLFSLLTCMQPKPTQKWLFNTAAPLCTTYHQPWPSPKDVTDKSNTLSLYMTTEACTQKGHSACPSLMRGDSGLSFAIMAG